MAINPTKSEKIWKANAYHRVDLIKPKSQSGLRRTTILLAISYDRAAQNVSYIFRDTYKDKWQSK